jgi:aryl-alcohol dehydrogenase-like predicted oxidoreductase
VITGASKVEQVEQNFGALDVIGRLDVDMLDRINSVLS